MKPGRPIASILSPAGTAALRSSIGPDTLFAFDLDGTLAPIVPDHSGILISPEVQERMSRLCRLATVAIITGRARADARTHFTFEPHYILGNHGAEGLPGRGNREKEFTELCRNWEEQLQVLLGKELSHIIIENKGPTVSLHYRKSPSPHDALRQIMLAVGKLEPHPRSIPGKFVENIVPEGAADKGDAILQIMEQTGLPRAVYVGDDVTDEDVFRLGGDRILGIRVGCDAASKARFCLFRQTQMLSLLDQILFMVRESMADTVG